MASCCKRIEVKAEVPKIVQEARSRLVGAEVEVLETNTNYRLASKPAKVLLACISANIRQV